MPLTITSVLNQPSDIKDAISKNFMVNAELNQKNPISKNHGYLSCGKKNYKYAFNCDSLHAVNTALIFTALTKLNPSARILDIGTGDGQLIDFINRFFTNFKATGLSACNMRTLETQHLSEEHYLVGNAELLLTDPALSDRKFDCIISYNTFLHFADPLGTLIQAYELLMEDGILIIDRFRLEGLDTLADNQYSWIDNLFFYLQQEGYNVDVGCSCTEVRYLFIKKTYPHLNLPISYQLNGKYIDYLPDESLLQFARQNMNLNNNQQANYLKQFLQKGLNFNTTEYKKIEKLIQKIIQLASNLNVQAADPSLLHNLETSNFPLFKILSTLTYFASQTYKAQVNIVYDLLEDYPENYQVLYDDDQVLNDHFMESFVQVVYQKMLYENASKFMAFNPSRVPLNTLQLAKNLESEPACPPLISRPQH